MMSYTFHPNTKSALWVVFATLIATAVLVVVMNFATPAFNSQADLPQERIVFMRHDGNDMELFTVNSDGTDERQLTNNDYTDWAPLWSADQNYIAFQSDRDGYDAIYVMSMNCSNYAVRVSPDGNAARYPSFSPDGTMIAFEMYMGNDNWEIYTMSLYDGSLQRMTNNDAIDGGASFSPDGTQLAYHSTQEGYYDIFLLDLETSQTKRMTVHPETMDVFPEWSPSGDSIIFHSERDGDSDIYIMNANGTNQRDLSNTDTLERTPRFSADGEHIVFRGEVDGISQLYIMDRNGDNVQPVTDGVSDWYPDF